MTEEDENQLARHGLGRISRLGTSSDSYEAVMPDEEVNEAEVGLRLPPGVTSIADYRVRGIKRR